VSTFYPLVFYKVLCNCNAKAFKSGVSGPLKNEMIFRTLIYTLINGSENQKESFETFLEKYEPFQMLYPKWIKLSKKTIMS